MWKGEGHDELDCLISQIVKVLSMVGWDNVVGIATRYGLDSPGVEFWWGQDFLH